MLKKFLALEEQYTVKIFSIITGIIMLTGYLFVMIFLNGTREDNIALILFLYCLLTYMVACRNPKAAKYMLTCTVALGSVVTIISNTGHYSGITQTYFLCLVIAVAHYDVLQVLLSTALTLITNVIGILLFPEPYLKTHSMTVWIFVLFTYIATAICAFIIAHRTHNLFEKERELQLTEFELSHLEKMEKKNNEHNKFIHNMHHYFTAIGSLALEQSCDEIVNILNDLNVEITKQQACFYTSHRVMNAILSEKYSLAKSLNLPMDIYVEPYVRLKNISDGDVVIILGNLLDNAIESAAKQIHSSSFIKVRIYQENGGKFCVIKIENSFHTPVRYNEKGLILTHKKHGLHGYGLKSINQTAKKYGGYLECSEKNNIFTSILLLPEASNVSTT
ncbi:MAG: sensor histidine kinase [Lachnospiraceae bacterium]|nr:sensor histidine kinase [Lachnospiraceae bacterium]